MIHLFWGSSLEVKWCKVHTNVFLFFAIKQLLLAETSGTGHNRLTYIKFQVSPLNLKNSQIDRFFFFFYYRYTDSRRAKKRNRFFLIHQSNYIINKIVFFFGPPVCRFWAPLFGQVLVAEDGPNICSLALDPIQNTLGQ